MFDNILNIYKDKIITNVDTFDIDNYFYFYNEHGKIFGIKKGLSTSEYQLLKSIYLEKTFYYNDQLTEKFHKFVFEEKAYPLEYERGRFFIINTLQNDINEHLLNLLKDILGEIIILKMNQSQIIFYFDNFGYELKDLINTFSDDTGTEINIHLGPYFNRNIKGALIAKYIYTYSSLPLLHKRNYSTFVDLMMALPQELYFDVIKIIQQMVLSNLDNDLIPLIKEFFKNNLNVSQTAKLNYLHRNSLINKLDLITKQTGLNIQEFHDAWAMNLLINANCL